MYISGVCKGRQNLRTLEALSKYHYIKGPKFWEQIRRGEYAREQFYIKLQFQTLSIDNNLGQDLDLISQKKTILSADNAGFKPKTGFGTEKPSFLQKLPFWVENLDSHCESCFTVVKQDVRFYVVWYGMVTMIISCYAKCVFLIGQIVVT